MMLGILQTAALWILPFLTVLMLVITVHELGHFLVARACGVAVDRFSIGFGKPIAKWRSRSGVEWRICWIPLGGYVKFSGDESIASVPDAEDLAALRKAVVARDGVSALGNYFHFKPLWQRALVVAAGPAANFLLAIVIFTGITLLIGAPTDSPKVSEVMPRGPAAAAGVMPDDLILSMDGHKITNRDQVMAYVGQHPRQTIQVAVERAGAVITLKATTATRRVQNPGTGAPATVGLLGVGFNGAVHVGPVAAVKRACTQVSEIVGGSLKYVGQMITGRAKGDQLSGPIGIAAASKAVATGAIQESATTGLKLANLGLAMTSMAAVLSVAVGFANLLPIPVLDGGHLLFYAYEGLARRPLAARVQDVGYRVGFAMLLGLMLFTTWNDLNRLRVFQFIGGLFS